MIFTEPITTTIELRAKTEREAYILVAINEILHTCGCIGESDYSQLYAVMSDNNMFKLF